MFTWVDVCSTQPLCRGIQSAFRHGAHQRPRRRRRRRVYFGPYRNNPDNNGVDQIVTVPGRALNARGSRRRSPRRIRRGAICAEGMGAVSECTLEHCFNVKMPARKGLKIIFCIYRDDLLQSDDSRHVGVYCGRQSAPFACCVPTPMLAT